MDAAVIIPADLNDISSFIGESIDSVLAEYREKTLSSVLALSSLPIVVKFEKRIVTVVIFGSTPAFAREATTFDQYNTTWIRFCYGSGDGMMEAFRYVFTMRPYISRIACASTGTKAKIISMFDVVASKDDQITISSLDSRAVIGTFTVRLACIEDYDDLSPIFTEKTKELYKNYGAFYLAELIASQNASNKSLALLHNGDPKGMVCITTEIKAEPLTNVYDLSSYPDFAVQKSICITVCCIDGDCAHASSRILLESIFAVFPERDYIILTLPHSADPSTHTFNHFTIIPTYQTTDFDHVLYLCHRATILKPPIVRIAAPSDEASIQDYLETSSVSLTSLRRNIADSRLCALFRDEQPTQCVGIIVAETITEQKLLDYADKFDIMQYHPELSSKNAAVLTTNFIAPILHGWRRLIFLQAMDQLQVDVLLYDPPLELISEVTDMLVDAQRRGLSSMNSSIPGLLIGTRSQISMSPVVYNNNRIVIIGLNKTSDGFLYELFKYTPHIIYTQIMVIIDSDYNGPLPLRYRIVTGSVTLADYATKTLSVDCRDSSSFTIPYDYLIISGDKQANNDAWSSPGTIPATTQHGVFSASKEDPNPWGPAFRFIQSITLGSSNIVVYGDSTDSLAVIGLLGRRGFDTTNICWVYPGSNHIWANGDIDIVQKIVQTFGGQGIEVISGHTLSRGPSSSGRLETVLVRGPGGSPRFRLGDNGDFIMSCAVVFNTAHKELPPLFRQALAHNPVAIDKGVIIDNAFHTNDPFVYAAGSIAQTSKSSCNSWDLDRCDPFELGSMMAKSFIRDSAPTCPIAVSDSPPYFRQKPLSVLVNLPGEASIFFRSSMPEATATRHLRTESTARLVKIGIDNIGRIMNITVCGTDVHHHNIMQLARFVGLPISFMNSIENRLSQGRIQDLADFLFESWSGPILHDRAPQLLQLLRVQLNDRVLQTLEPAIEQVLEKGVVDLEHVKNRVDQQMESQSHKALVDFIRRNERDLPGYLYR